MKTDEVLQEALTVLRGGGVILYPTDTVWGIGCDATDPSAVARVYEIKHRADSKSLVLLAADLDMVARYVKAVPNIAIDLVEGNDRPMTLIYPGAICGSKPADETVGQAPAGGVTQPQRSEDGRSRCGSRPAGKEQGAKQADSHQATAFMVGL